MFNKETVKSLAHSTPTASAIFLAFSQRERSRQVINLDLIEARLVAQGVKIDTKDFLETFKSLEQLQIGQLVYGRKGNPNSFVWKYDLRDVASIGLGGSNTEPKPVVLRNPRGVMRVTTPVVKTAGPSNKAAQVNVEKPKAISKTEDKARAKTWSRARKYVTIQIPIEMLKGIKGLK